MPPSGVRPIMAAAGRPKAGERVAECSEEPDRAAGRPDLGRPSSGFAITVASSASSVVTCSPRAFRVHRTAFDANGDRIAGMAHYMMRQGWHCTAHGWSWVLDTWTYKPQDHVFNGTVWGLPADGLPEPWKPFHTLDLIVPYSGGIIARTPVDDLNYRPALKPVQKLTATVEVVGVPEYRIPADPLWFEQLDGLLARQRDQGDIRHVIAGWLEDHGREEDAAVLMQERPRGRGVATIGSMTLPVTISQHTIVNPVAFINGLRRGVLGSHARQHGVQLPGFDRQVIFSSPGFEVTAE